MLKHHLTLCVGSFIKFVILYLTIVYEFVIMYVIMPKNVINFAFIYIQN
jgi:hypothetical protein